MKNLSIHFSYPWLLLLLIPAVIFTLIPYFRLAKRYRKTRNRITSIVLHLIVMVLSITALAGMRFDYDVPNYSNEIILLVDLSDTEEQASEARDEFVELVLKDSQYDNYNVGVVTFGFDQEYAVPLTDDVEGIYDKYLRAEYPDTSATNIKGALEYAKGLFTNPQTGKIVLITDGKETDGEASSVIRSIASQGIKVDVAYIPSQYEGEDIQLVEATLPDYHVNVGETCAITLTLQSGSAGSVNIGLYDNGEILDSDTDTVTVDLIEGSQTVSFNHVFKEEGLHEIRFELNDGGDLLEQNNKYYSYLYLEVYNKILVLESIDDQSLALIEMINEEQNGEEPYVVTCQNIKTDVIPTTVDELRQYDQVILNNIAAGDMPYGFDSILKEYVEVYGGGLFTVGGNDEEGNAHTYNRLDMRSKPDFHEMLPVQAIDYTPPVGVVFILDRSGSMDADDGTGENRLAWARAAAASCVQQLSERDYVGIVTLDTTENMILEMTPRTQEGKILAAISSIEDVTGGTVFPGAIQQAGQLLRSLNVAKRHIILISDCQISDDQPEKYEPMIEDFNKRDGTTFSIIGMGLNSDNAWYDEMKKAAETLGGGELYCVDDSNMQTVIGTVAKDISAPRITDIVIPEEGFKPIVNNGASALVQGLERGVGSDINKLTVSLDGFYGVKVRSAADLILVGDYAVPIYAQWKYGNGMVGSFMCDLNGTWSSDFMTDENGKTFIKNVINNLMPLQNIRPNELRVNLKEDNYTNQLSVYTELDEGEYVSGQIVQLSAAEPVVTSLNSVAASTDRDEVKNLACYVTEALSAENAYSRCTFIVKQSGVYRIELTKYAADGTVIDTYTTHKSFAYSEEYDAYLEETETELIARLDELAARGNGQRVADLEDPVEIFEGFITATGRSFDPRFLFMIMAIVLFLLDIAVRKFKFKWPHEIIREYKNKKNSK